MSIFTNFLRSLALTILFSALAPLVSFGLVLGGAQLLGYVPGLASVSVVIANGIKVFLSIFGSGNPVGGLATISFTCGFVGILFDLYVHYRSLILHMDS